MQPLASAVPAMVRKERRRLRAVKRALEIVKKEERRSEQVERASRLMPANNDGDAMRRRPATA